MGAHGYLCTCARADRTSVSQKRLGRLGSILVCELGVMNWVLNTSHGWSISARAHVHPPPPPHLRISGSDLPILLKFDVWLDSRDPIVMRLTKVVGGVTAHLHARLQFRCLGNRSVLTLKPHQKQAYLFWARSYIATHGVLLVLLAYVSFSIYSSYHARH